MKLRSNFFIFTLLSYLKSTQKRPMNRIFLLFLFCPFVAFAQKQGNNWFFGDSAAITFNTGIPTPITNGQVAIPIGQSHSEGSSTISDSSGALLLYSNGMTVWNKFHQVIQNGTGLLGNFSSTQSSVIVPDPADPDRYYYLFTISSGFCCNGNVSDGMRYSIIDICADGARGAVIGTAKNIKVVDNVAEKIAVTRHANGVDYWILTHTFPSNQFWALHLSNIGIVDTVISAIGSTHSGNIGKTQGQMKFSPDGTRIAVGGSNALDILDVFDFDAATGVVSNHMALTKPNNNSVSVYGVEFSPDNTKLYAKGLTSFALLYMIFFQYDLSAGNQAAIDASMYVIQRDSFGLIAPTGLQLGPDGKIYVPSTNNMMTLGVVQSPNTAGVGCNFQDMSISLGGQTNIYTLPTIIAGYDYSNTEPKCSFTAIDETNISGQVNVYPNPSPELFTFTFPNTSNEGYQLTIRSLTGQVVFQAANLRGTAYRFEAQTLAPGTYVYRFDAADGHFAVGKLVVQ
jgi:large repetitive protein